MLESSLIALCAIVGFHPNIGEIFHFDFLRQMFHRHFSISIQLYEKQNKFERKSLRLQPWPIVCTAKSKKMFPIRRLSAQIDVKSNRFSVKFVAKRYFSIISMQKLQVSDFQTPSVELLGQLQQGKYAIKSLENFFNFSSTFSFEFSSGSVFLNEYDPLHVIMRCTKRAHFQNSLERFTNLQRKKQRFSFGFR